MPARIVLRDIPVARATVEIPPRESAMASLAAHCRRTRSFITGSRATNFRRIPSATKASCIYAICHIRLEWSSYSCARPKQLGCPAGGITKRLRSHSLCQGDSGEPSPFFCETPRIRRGRLCCPRRRASSFCAVGRRRGLRSRFMPGNAHELAASPCANPFSASAPARRDIALMQRRAESDWVVPFDCRLFWGVVSRG